jgi:hypothetical protein
MEDAETSTWPVPRALLGTRVRAPIQINNLTLEPSSAGLHSNRSGTAFSTKRTQLARGAPRCSSRLLRDLFNSPERKMALFCKIAFRGRSRALETTATKRSRHHCNQMKTIHLTRPFVLLKRPRATMGVHAAPRRSASPSRDPHLRRERIVISNRIGPPLSGGPFVL